MGIAEVTMRRPRRASPRCNCATRLTPLRPRRKARDVTRRKARDVIGRRQPGRAGIAGSPGWWEPTAAWLGHPTPPAPSEKRDLCWAAAQLLRGVSSAGSSQSLRLWSNVRDVASGSRRTNEGGGLMTRRSSRLAAVVASSLLAAATGVIAAQPASAACGGVSTPRVRY